MKKDSTNSGYFEKYDTFKLEQISGRYLNYGHIEDSIKKFEQRLKMKLPGKSTLGIPVPSFIIGEGPTKILAWSQMHGNETTTTKAILDILNGIYNKESIFDEILENCTICIIPMLNPDGAKVYTRENANSVDLNRDAQNLSQVESLLLRKVFENFKPDFCFNLHDQRTIFSAGDRPSPATLSFLTPAIDEERSITESRIKSMKVIAFVIKELEPVISDSIGRYDDVFNLDCTGDTFQNLGVPTILFEAGHFPEDYEREETRKIVGAAIFFALYAIASNKFIEAEHSDYLRIPENKKLFVDILLKNSLIDGELVNIAIQYREDLEGNVIHLVPVIQSISAEFKLFGHREIDCGKQVVKMENHVKLGENVIVKEIYINNELLAIN